MNRDNCYVRVTHIPTSTSVEVTDGYYKTARAKSRALKKLRSLLYARQCGIVPTAQLVAVYDLGEQIDTNDLLDFRQLVDSLKF